ncbi:MFS transporter [Nocardioides sp. cx-173]|uniref:MFS transporter n=1 Tax=Nocardioides sp. cx-173 TaxID=2898796 RepID=UPI001E32B50B|nr:MFS transporter [Nocardioides sp. cx-173]MCD4526591.1 MFS transporter [Nocardioides sp. cx-173]UGB40686.1 MFS transporter [Nocardioides sp. cx-173]
MGDLADARGLAYSVRAFRHRDYLIFWCGALASNVGTWLTNLAVPYVLYELTQSAFWVGLAALAQFLPGVLCAPLGGSLADRFDRRRLLLATQAGGALAAAGLCVLWFVGRHEPVAIMAVMAVSGVFHGINLPSWQSFVNDLVPRADLTSAIALNSLQFNAARSIGPAIAGLLLATLGPGWAFLLNALSFGFVIWALFTVRARPRPGAVPGTAGTFSGFAEALRYVRGQRGIQVAIIVSVLIGFFANPIFGFTVVFADEIFTVGAVGLGLLNAALGIGSLLAAPLVSGGFLRLTLSRMVRWALPLCALGMLGFAAAPNLPLAALSLMLVGASFLAVVSSANTAIQLIVADHVRGRVLAVRIMIFTGSFPLGALGQGWLSDRVGPQVTVAGGAVALGLLALAFGGWRGGAVLRRLDDPRDRSGPGAPGGVPKDGTLRACAPGSEA